MEKRIEKEGKEFKIRGLKRREVKQFKREGINFAKLDDTTADDAMDKVVAVIGLDLEEIDELSNTSCLELFQEIMELTFQTEKQRKNSSSPSTS